MSAIAALYRNPDAAKSEKARPFSLNEIEQIVRYSGAPEPSRDITLIALAIRGEWPKEKGPPTPVLRISLHSLMLETGHCRSTIQRRIKRACKLKLWRRTHDDNYWTDCPKCGEKRSLGTCEKCGYKGKVKDDSGNFTGEFWRTPTYEFDVEKFRAWPRCREIHHSDFRSYEEFRSFDRGGERAKVTEMPSRKPAQGEKPAAEHRGTARITRDARQALFNAYLALKNSGMTHDKALGEVVKQFKNRFSSEDVEFALKLVGHKDGHDVTSETSAEPARTVVDPEKCPQCGAFLAQNRGPGPRLICPRCAANSS